MPIPVHPYTPKPPKIRAILLNHSKVRRHKLSGQTSRVWPLTLTRNEGIEMRQAKAMDGGPDVGVKFGATITC